MSEKKTKEKRVLYEEGNIRIKEYDAMNVTIERLETYEISVAKGEKAMKTAWRFKGYSPNALSALKLIHAKRWLDDIKAHSTIKSALESMRASDERIMRAIKEVSK